MLLLLLLRLCFCYHCSSRCSGHIERWLNAAGRETVGDYYYYWVFLSCSGLHRPPWLGPFSSVAVVVLETRARIVNTVYCGSH